MIGQRTEAKTAVEVYRQASKSIVIIKSLDEKGNLLCTGSGVILNNASNVVTNYHVIEQASTFAVVYQNKEYTATLKHIDRIRDVCSLSVSGLPASPAPIGNSTRVEIGSRVYAIGFPMNAGLTFSDGMVSSFREGAGGRYIQFTAPISAGSSGGGLFDEQGQLIGIPTYFISQGQLLNFALPVEWVAELPRRNDLMAERSSNQQPFDSEFQCKAIELEEQENWAALTELARRWTAASPENAVAWEMLGSAYANSGALTPALAAYMNAIKFNPDSMQNWLQLGLIYGKTNQRNKAIEAFRMVVRINPDYSRAWLMLATIYRDTDLFDDALHACQQVIRINPANESGWIQLGYAYGKLGEPAKQISAYLEAIRINQFADDAYVCLGIAYGSTKRELAEAEAYHQALIIHPDESAAIFNLGHYYLRHGNTAIGMTFYERLKVLRPKLARIFFDDPNHRICPETLQQQ